MTAEGARKVGRIWFIGACIYIACAVFLAFAQLFLPAFGAAIVLVCAMATTDFDATLSRWLIVAFGLQSALATFVLVGPRHSLLGDVLSALAVFGPFIAGAAFTRIARRRAVVAAPPEPS